MPPKVHSIIYNTQDKRHGTTDCFQMGKGVHQGYRHPAYLTYTTRLKRLSSSSSRVHHALDEAQAGIKTAGRNTNNFIYAGDSTLTQKAKRN